MILVASPSSWGGGTGDVGVGIVGALTEAGARVVVPARSVQKAELLKNGLSKPERLIVINTLPVDEAGVSTLRNQLADLGPLDGAIASLGSWFSFGSLMETTAENLQAAFDSLLMSHVLFARSVVPVLVPGATYITINGAGSETPVPDSSAVSIMTHGLNMVTSTLEAEHPEIHVHTMMLRSVIATRARPQHDPSWVTAEEVGQAAAMLLTPLGRLSRGSIFTLNTKPPISA